MKWDETTNVFDTVLAQMLENQIEIMSALKVRSSVINETEIVLESYLRNQGLKERPERTD